MLCLTTRLLETGNSVFRRVSSHQASDSVYFRKQTCVSESKIKVFVPATLAFLFQFVSQCCAAELTNKYKQ